MDLGGSREDSLMPHSPEHWVGESVQGSCQLKVRRIQRLAPAEEWRLHARRVHQSIGRLSVSTFASAPPPDLLCLLCAVAPLTLESPKPTEKKKWKEAHICRRWKWETSQSRLLVFVRPAKLCWDCTTAFSVGESLREEGDAIYRALAVTVLHTCHSHWPLRKNTHRPTHTNTGNKHKCSEPQTF